MKPRLFLICGQIGSGKTTFAKKLEAETGAVRFTPDEWMLKLYPEMPNKEEFDNYYYRCCDIIKSISAEIIKRGGDVILDFGFWKRKDRDQYFKFAADIGAEPTLYFISCCNDVIRERLLVRNKVKPEGAVEITDDMFEYYSPGFEKPGEDEKYTLIQNNH